MTTFDEQNHIIYIRKILNDYKSRATANAKSDTCYLCQKKSSSFCNSHSVPKFCLKNIAAQGEVYYINTILKNKCISASEGIGRAGVFKIICRDCDSKWFQDYENPSSYEKRMSKQMMAQIALKDSLLMLSKRFHEKELYKLFADKNELYKLFANEREVYKLFADKIEVVSAIASHQLRNIEADIIDYQKMFDYANALCRINKEKFKSNYRLVFYQVLDYVVPLAFQGPIALRFGFDKKVINDIYNTSPKYRIQSIHIGVFPIKDKTIVFLFYEKKDKKYRRFFKDFHKYSAKDQLGIINYIIFLYSENFFLSPNIDVEIFNDESFKSIVRCETDIITEIPISKDEMIKYNLQNWNNIPNFLSEKFAIKK